MSLESDIEAILFWKGEAVSTKELAKILETDTDAIKNAIAQLEKSLQGRGITIVRTGEEAMLYTSPDSSELIKKITKEELSRDISKASVEVLSLIIYRGPISKQEIDYIRGVNSNYIIRNLLVRGLIERSDEVSSRSFAYEPTLQLLAHLGITKKEELPDFEKVEKDIANFMLSDSKTEEKNG